MSSSASAGGGSSSNEAGQGISIADLSLPQLADVRRQLEQEIEHLSDSFGALRTAQAKFKSCLEALESLSAPGAQDKDTLVPLTASLYVPGKLADVEHVLVDIGTGYYVEKETPAAKQLYQERAEFVGKKIEELQNMLTQKNANLSSVVDIQRMKVAEAQGEAASAAA
ncbi:subunit of tubulin prefoldin [Tilletia horrida]|uniref:Subunit of tubulin prefoldin n=1 Tax=Tilletia horrida TaxID=155126 RepID=A0AAN6JZX3_9BASI|nr:subunit of tubulin prefoldin [Tilletia horrida]KAK0556097.1 subunit of tubulin prefoldin [Tilletia horrida]KAK0568779.1 subunit of tubulin prefoldin [Tilletia horrida]